MLACMLTALPAQGAERIQFFFGPFEPTIYVEDLETFAKTGEVAERLAPFANRLNNQQQQAFRGILGARNDLSPIPVAQFTYSTLGENLLGKLGQVIQTDNFLNGMKGIRGALILAADDKENGGLTTLNVLRHFPTKTVQVDFALARQIIAENAQIFMRRDSVVADIKQLAQSQAMDKAALSMGDDPRLAGTYRWQVKTLPFQTPGRPEASIADLYLPEQSAATAESTPVVIISHGVASTRKTFVYMAEHLASHGYAVVALEHIETSADKFIRFLWGKEDAPGGRELLLRSQDITAVLDTLSAQQAEGEPTLSSLNLDSVGLLGQSLGGYTVLASGGAGIDPAFLAQECQSSLADRPTVNLSLLTQCTLLELPEETPLDVADDRVSAVVAMNPLTSSIFGKGGLQKIEIPVMIMAGTNDYVAPALPEQIEPFNWLTTEHKKLVVMDGGTHFSFLDRQTQSVLPFSDGLTGPDPLAAREPTRALSLAFFNRHLLNQSDAEQFLNQTYLNEFPTEPFQFSVVDDLAGAKTIKPVGM
ncbi:MAG: alpha/beta hydrolase [Cyanobacteria bacterium P01_F01_bin.53]